MPLDWGISTGDVLCNVNGGSDVVVIFGSANGGWDYSGLMQNAFGCDLYGIRDEKRSWFQDPGKSFSGLDHIDDYLCELLSKYSGKKIFCGVSMGGTAALYFGSRHTDVSVVAASPQFFQYQFLWDFGARPHFEIIEKLPARIRRRKATDIEVIVCGDGDDLQWNWRDCHAANLAEDLFGLPITRLPGTKHACWELFSMRERIEGLLGYRIIDKANMSVSL
ncbi:hypothetical protein G6L16_009005 [Agrobacterium tumefaciens]|uniref:hypothetical protein n=1 Tax=Agrobacterium tumefaciens TaxID=358 RepID=UPI0015740771|nr:hypothetical protein [Agrobacterium tumefaciens]NSZ63477.1 esterase family protein [Agrobacterium tumefaciens]NTA69847.1 esterase family protein [Agrobacterium tumefaciens]WIE36992.1 hypothetical protein G6L16_009005 [Agrobacterium tumefaciens]